MKGAFSAKSIIFFINRYNKSTGLEIKENPGTIESAPKGIIKLKIGKTIIVINGLPMER